MTDFHEELATLERRDSDATAPENVVALEEEIATLAAHIHAAELRFLELIRRFDEAKGWHGFRSCAHWLAWRVGINQGAAREKVRVAKALPQLPRIREAFRRGRLSYSKVRAMTRVATPTNEEPLLRIAEAGTASHVEKVVRTYRQTQLLTDPNHPRLQHQDRCLRTYYDEDGMLVVEGRLPPEQGALFVQALRAAEEALWNERRASEEQPPSEPTSVPPETPLLPEEPLEAPQARRADALALLAEIALADPAGKLETANHHQVVLHVPVFAPGGASNQTNDVLPIDGFPYLHDGPPVSAETARRLACDASRITLTETPDGHPLNVGRKTRTIPPALRRALQVRDRGCRFPGCTAHHFVDAHHIHHWADGGETRLDNLVTLCRFHHRLLHEEGYFIDRQAPGQLRFHRPDGSPISDVPPFPALPTDPQTELEATHREDSLDIHAQTIPVWMGDRLDMDIAMGWLGR